MLYDENCSAGCVVPFAKLSLNELYNVHTEKCTNPKYTAQ